jgi:PAS domain S-box-containing protein
LKAVTQSPGQPRLNLRTGEQTPARTWIIPAILGTGSLLLTLLLWQLTILQSRQADQIRFERLADRVQKNITDRLRQHEYVLDGLKGLFAASKSVERGEFRQYVKSLELSAFRGALGFGFVRYVPRERLGSFLAQTRADEAPDFSLKLTSGQPDLFIVEYIEPLGPNLAAQGLDIGAESVRREAATRAVKENRTILTRRINLVQDKQRRPGFLLILPVYANQAATATIANRWQALIGWVYSPILIDGLMAGVTADAANQVGFEVRENDPSGRTTLLYESDEAHGTGAAGRMSGLNVAPATITRTDQLSFGGHQWQLRTGTRPEFSDGSDRRLSWLVLIGGLVVTYVANSSHRSRRKAVALAATMTVELREEIAQREVTDRALREAASFQDAILNSAGYAIISTTPEGVIRIFNPAAQRMLGYTEEEMIGRQTPALFHDPAEVAARAREFGTELGCTVEPGFDVFVIKSCRGRPNEHEWTYVRKDGSRLPVMLSVTAIRDEQGGFAGYLGVAVDITERKRAWAELLQSRQASDAALHEVELQRDALDQHAIVSITDLRGIIQHANDRFCAISGYTHAELIGQPHRIINSGQHPREYWQEFWRTITAGEIWQGEICNRAKTGALYWVQATVVPFRDPVGKIDRFVAIRTDITARKLAETELREARKNADAANQSKSEFLAEMSHEIRTPMSAVLGFTELLAETPLNDKQRNFVETIQLSGQNLITIINDILDYSKIEAGKLEFETTDFDALDTIEAVLKTLSLPAKTKSLTLSLLSLPGAPHRITADPIRVRQILINLVGNALKFTKRGGVTITTEPKLIDGAPGLRINVTDTGIGLSPSQQARLFTKFTQAKTSITREFGGTGLGLAICKRLVELMGGEIGVQSIESRGSTFWFTLPFATQGAKSTTTPSVAPRPASAEPMPLPALPTHAPRVLVTDDNLINQQLAQAFLTKLNCVTTLAYNGAEALKLVQQETFDLVLMDYQMPEMNGMQATVAIRQWESGQPHRRRLPIIALTANLNPELAGRFLDCGMDQCLGKPLLFQALANVVHELLAGPSIARSAPPAAPPSPVGTKAENCTEKTLRSDVAAGVPAGRESEAVSANLAAMDRAQALLLTDNNPELLGMLAQAFLTQSVGLMASINEALQARDARALKQHAHKLKGSVSVFAASDVQASVLALNKFPEPPDWAMLDRQGRELEREIARLRPELAALTPGLVTSSA